MASAGAACTRLIRAVALTGTAALAGGLAAWPAQAQLIDRFLSIDSSLAVQPGAASRLRQQSDSGSVRLGSFIIRPEVLVGAGYDDNTLGTDPARGSALVRTGATLQAASDWSRHALSAAAAVEDNRYVSRPGQSYTNWSVAAAGGYEIGRDVVRLSGSAQRLTQTVRDLDVPQVDQTLGYYVNTVRLGYRAAFNRLSLEPALEVLTYRYENGNALGVPYLQDYRNRNVIAPNLVASYELAPRRNVIAAVRGAVANYTKRTPGTVERDFNDVSALVGLDYEATDLWRYRILVGVQRREFTDAQLKSITAPIIEGSVIWTPSRLTRVSGVVSRRIQDTADETDVGLTETALRLAVDHEYLRDVFLRATPGCRSVSTAKPGAFRRW